MVAPVFQGDVTQVQYDGPGLILLADYADLVATPSDIVPTWASVNNAFTNSWDNMWVPAGFTDDGFEIDFDSTTTEITAAERITPLDTVETARPVSVKFSMMQSNKFNIQRALNGGTWTQTGTGATAVSKYKPAVIGARKYTAIAWLSASYDEAIIVYRTSQTGSIAFTAKQLGTKRVLACNFSMAEPDATVSTDPWNMWIAGEKYNTVVAA